MYTLKPAAAQHRHHVKYQPTNSQTCSSLLWNLILLTFWKKGLQRLSNLLDRSSIESRIFSTLINIEHLLSGEYGTEVSLCLANRVVSDAVLLRSSKNVFSDNFPRLSTMWADNDWTFFLFFFCLAVVPFRTKDPFLNKELLPSLKVKLL